MAASAIPASEMNPRQLSDLRRSSLPDVRERVLEHVDLLLPDDRALIRAVYLDGQSVRHFCSVAGLDYGRTKLRCRRHVARMASPLFAYVLGRRDDWPPTRRRVATAVVLQGRSLRKAASHLRLSLHVVRRQMDVVNALHAAGA